jgi:hypothetical protein
LTHKATGKRYYGVRCSKDSNPSQLWVSYFSSSKIVKEIVAEEGKDSFSVEVRRTFSSKEKALRWEHKLLSRINAAKSKSWYNRHNGGKQFSCTSHTNESKSKISKSLSGRSKTLEHRAKIAEKSTWDGKVTREQRSLAQKGRVHARGGVERMRAAKIGKKRQYRADGSFFMV